MSDHGGSSDLPAMPVENPYAVTETSRNPAKPDESIRLRVWPCFVAMAAAMSAAIGSQIIVVLLLFAIRSGNGESLQETTTSLPEMLTQPQWIIGLGLLSQLPIIAAAVIAAWLSPSESFRQRLKLNPTGWSFHKYVTITLSVIFPGAIGMLLAGALTFLIPPDESVAMLYENMTVAWAVPFLLFISLAPGFGEEFLFRGYVQGRFLKRWSPMTSIIVSSIIFGVFHIMPHAVLFATVVGFWLGYVAWKADSIWPTIICHAFLNGAWNILNLSMQFTGMTDSVYYGICGGLTLIGLIAFALSFRILGSTPPTGAAALPQTQSEFSLPE